MSYFTYDLAAHDGEDFDSGSIDALYYDRETNSLGVEFVSAGTVYVYDDVAESTFNLFKAASSLNTFYRNHIQTKGHHSRTYEGAALNPRVNPRVNGTADHADENAWVASPPVEETVTTVDDAYSKFGVKWTGSFNDSDERTGPFEYLVQATSVDEALHDFNRSAANLFGTKANIKIVSVTHYFA